MNAAPTERYVVQQGTDTIGDEYRLEHDPHGYWLVRPDGFETRLATRQGVDRVLAWPDEQPRHLGTGTLTDGRVIAVYVTTVGPAAIIARDTATGQRVRDHAVLDLAIRIGQEAIGIVGII